MNGEMFLRDFHSRQAGITSKAFLHGRTPDGSSSYELLARDVEDFASSDSVVLDLACGDGVLLDLLSQRLPRAKLLGADMSAEEVVLAKQRLGTRAEIMLANARELPLEANSVNAVTCHFAFMLMDDPHLVVSELKRVVSSGGVFTAIIGGQGLTQTNVAFSAVLRKLTEAERLPPLRLGDARAFDRESMHELFSAGGFRSTKAEIFDLDLTGSVEQVLLTLMGVYDVALLSPNGRHSLESATRAVAEQARGIDGNVPLAIKTLHFRAIRD